VQSSLAGRVYEREGALFERRDDDPVMRRTEPRRLANDVDQPGDRVQAAEQVVVRAIGAGQERPEISKAIALSLLAPTLT
jgi:hypothetical protein